MVPTRLRRLSAVQSDRAQEVGPALGPDFDQVGHAEGGGLLDVPRVAAEKDPLLPAG